MARDGIRPLPSGKYQATVYLPDGRRTTRTHSLRRVVKEWKAEQESRLRTGTWTEPALGKVTLAEWWDRWQSTRRVETATSDRNDSQWTVHVAPKFGTWPLVAITSWEIEGWVSDMTAGRTRTRAGKPYPVGAETVASSLRLLRHMLAEAVRHRLIPSNPAELVKAPTPEKHVDRYITRAEADRIIAALTGQDVLFVSILFDCGLRWAEAAALRGADVDLMRRQLHVGKAFRRRKKDGKREKEPKAASVRDVPLTDELVHLLSAHMADRERSGLLFVGRDGAEFDYTNWRRRSWLEALKSAGLDHPQPTPHDARHAYGSWLGEAGVPQRQIAALMGHSSTRSTERYVHATPARMDQARAALEALRAPQGTSETRQSEA